MNCERCGKAGACKVGGNPWLCDPCFWEHMNEGIAALMDRMCAARPPPETPRDPVRVLREAARDVLAAYDFCRSKGSFSGFWTHIDDLAKALDAYPIDTPPETSERNWRAQFCVSCGAAVPQTEEEFERWRSTSFPGRLVLTVVPAPETPAPTQGDPRIPDDREEET